ncbi:IS66 family insertion sequence element accessory protein TnpB [Paenibacillus sp. TAF58]
MKMLFWEHNGFWLFYRRLERGTFGWPAEPKASWSFLCVSLFHICTLVK